MSPSRTALWLTVGKVVNQSVAFLIPLFLARLLSKGDYGAFKQIDLVSGILWTFLLLGLDRSLTNYLPRKGYDPRREASTVVWTVVTGAAVFLGSMVLFPKLLQALFALEPIFSLHLATLSYSLSKALTQLTQRCLLAAEQGRPAAVMPVVLQLPYVIGLLVGAAARVSLATFCYIVAGHGVFVSLACAFILWRSKLLGLYFDWQVFKRHIVFSAPLWLISAVQSWGARMGRLLVNWSMGSEALATYTVGMSGIPVLLMLPASVRDATAPTFARYESEGRRRDIASLWKSGSEMLLPVCGLATVAQIYLAHLLVPLLYTEQFRDATGVFVVMSVNTFLGIFIGLESVLRAFAAFRYLTVLTFVSLVLRVGLGLAVLPLRSLTLQAAAQVAVTGLVVVVHLNYTRHQLGVRWRDMLPTHGWGASLALSLLCILVSLPLDARLRHLALLPHTLILLVPWGMAGLLALYRLRRRLRDQTRARGAAAAAPSEAAGPSDEEDAPR